MTSTEDCGLIPLSDAEKAEACAMLRDGATKAEVCEWIGCEMKQLNRIGAPRERIIVNTPEIIARKEARKREILRLRTQEHLTRSQIAAKLNVTRSTVLGVLYRSGVRG